MPGKKARPEPQSLFLTPKSCFAATLFQNSEESVLAIHGAEAGSPTEIYTAT